MESDVVENDLDKGDEQVFHYLGASRTSDRELPDHQELQGRAKISSGRWKADEDQLGRPPAHLLPRPVDGA